MATQLVMKKVKQAAIWC